MEVDRRRRAGLRVLAWPFGEAVLAPDHRSEVATDPQVVETPQLANRKSMKPTMKKNGHDHHPIATALAEAVGGKPGTAGHSHALDVLTGKSKPRKRKAPAQPVAPGTWWMTANHTGRSVPVPGFGRLDGHAALIKGAELLGVKPEYVRPEWVSAVPEATNQERGK